MRECCESCEFFCAVRKLPIYREVLTHICTLFLVTEKADYILEVTGNDVCECWTKRRTDNERKAD